MNWARVQNKYEVKRRRPFSSKKAIHIVLRSRYFSLRRAGNLKLIGDLLFHYAHRFGVKIYQNSVNTNHIHLILKADSRENLQAFLRVFAGQIAQRITGCVKGRKLKCSFWAKIAWSRIIEWGRGFKVACDYVYLNQRETLGLSHYRQRTILRL